MGLPTWPIDPKWRAARAEKADQHWVEMAKLGREYSMVISLTQRSWRGRGKNDQLLVLEHEHAPRTR